MLFKHSVYKNSCILKLQSSLLLFLQANCNKFIRKLITQIRIEAPFRPSSFLFVSVAKYDAWGNLSLARNSWSWTHFYWNEFDGKKIAEQQQCDHTLTLSLTLTKFYSATESILPGQRLATWRHKFQCFIQYVMLFHPCFWFALCKSALSCVFLCFFRECSHANMLFCVYFHGRTTHFTFTLCLFKFPTTC